MGNGHGGDAGSRYAVHLITIIAQCTSRHLSAPPGLLAWVECGGCTQYGQNNGEYILYIVNCLEIVPSFAIEHNIKSWISVFTLTREKLESTC